MEPEEEGRGWHGVTIFLIVATVLGYVGQRMLALDDLGAMVRLGALQPDRVATDGEYFRLVMPIFLHNGLFHLLVNTLALVQLALLVEEFFGGRRLLVTYLWSGVAGLLCSSYFTPVPYVTSVGASGAVLGLAGLLLGTMWFGADPVRSELQALLGRRLFWSVALTFGFGAALWFVSDFIDNWAHAGGFLCGVAFSFVWGESEAGDEADEEEDASDPRVLAFATAFSVALLVVAMVWTAARGGVALQTLPLDAARVYAVRISRAPGAWQNPALLVEMLNRYEQAHAEAEGLAAFERGLGHLDDPYLVALLGDLLIRETQAGKERDGALLATGERWIALEPTRSAALNFLAWHLVITKDPARRDPARAESLAAEALRRIAETETELGRTETAVYLDTHAEALYQLGRLEEAAADQRRAADLGRELALEDLPEIEARLLKIERSLGRG